jgi:cysteine desulfuration protein SufE
MPEIADFIDDFELLGDWEARYAYLTELGEQLPPMPEELKTEENRVKGCMSTVHVAAVPNAEPGRIVFHGDCDTATIKGVLGILVPMLSHKTPSEVLDTDIDRLFEGLKLEEHLSPNRHFGIYAIVEQMKTQAERLMASQHTASGH